MSDRKRLENRIGKAVGRALISGQPSVITLAAGAGEVDPLAFVVGGGPPFAYWEMPGRGFSIGAVGEAVTIEPGDGPGRFRSASAALRSLAARTHPVAVDGVERTPVLIGGFSFHSRSTWPRFSSGRLVLPDLALIRRRPGRGVWVAAAEVTADDDPAAVADRLTERIRACRSRRLPRITPEVVDHPAARTVDLGDRTFLAQAAAAIESIRRTDPIPSARPSGIPGSDESPPAATRQGAIRKVVLARHLDVEHRPELGPFLAALRHINHRSAVFAFGRRDGSVFCGATPELLARVDGVKVSTLALAGTAPRGASAAEDTLIADRLRNHPKELEEHRYVASEISQRLEARGFAVEDRGPTYVMRLPGIQHLATPVSAVAPVGTNVLDVVGALHPTPAVAGVPRDRALAWISEHEPLQRGWYAGPVGYCDLAGNGEFHVALRSCLIEDGRTRLFAGAGIVGTSAPEAELEETNLKLDTVLSSLFGMKDHRWRSYATADALVAALRSGRPAGVVISPGSRSTPLALAAASGGLPVRVVLDERSAGFVALGMAKASRRPTALICTSGSAAANYLPAVAEADRARTPLVVVTADRPPGFLARDTPQTIDQVGLYGSHVRAASNLGVAHECNPQDVRDETLRLLEAARSPNAGPVHINVPFAKPLEPPDGDRMRIGAIPHEAQVRKGTDATSVTMLTEFIAGAERGLIVAGPRATDPAERAELVRFSKATGWPIMADGMSGMRSSSHEYLITTGDLLLRDMRFASEHLPDAILRIGATPTGTITQNWLAALEAPVALLDPDYRWTAPGPAMVLRDPITGVLEAVSPTPLDPGWSESWRAAETRVRGLRRREVSRHPDTELAVTAAVLESERLVWAASSMPVRHVDAMMEPGCGAEVLGNRGACGIDGTIASATGAALASGQRVTVLVGDLAFLHDAGSLSTARHLRANLSVVVLDNGGGAIFEMLPYLRSLRETGDTEALAQARELFVTPHEHDLAAVAAGFGVSAERVSPLRITDALAGAHEQAGPRVFVIPSDPSAMFAAYDRLSGR
ncbi:MAG: 2-succinyl-5-enolpyruvyl-6-hydroxy-3-cyclohexene-1-carboxylic-acid synthase [bacterium]|nr:2-succinyl-5-enolpyruvyl-6-hydroxy-3-cyclohexene-1-carboxylic-acid synthase [bacterium]MDE0287354.1 2-succinyl-5-enolpyruvyl-6-hydroxy-3-cyclohexene-1-carboxylic-acid synthase [bacterium]MDE0439173.1 2-succinyl-5-enolpyruvyl-6-hydroxy-3-cyclohexene-1-carboxylic-acid synthase [bacterium]